MEPRIIIVLELEQQHHAFRLTIILPGRFLQAELPDHQHVLSDCAFPSATPVADRQRRPRVVRNYEGVSI